MTTATAERAPKAKKRVTIEDLKDDFLECRDLRHAWTRATDWSTVRNTAGAIVEFTRVVICRRCRTERHETYRVPSMELVRRRYVYPENFLLQGIGEAGSHPNVQDIRREVFQRVYASGAHVR